MADDVKEAQGLSRRELLKGAGKASAVGGLAVISVGGLGMLAGCGDSGTGTSTAASKGTALPWPYRNMDAASITRMQETAHENWFTGFCAFATLSGIMTQLRDQVGEPWTTYPMEAIIYAHGGTAGWGGTCGTLIGAGMAASLAAGPKVGEQVLNEVMRWYAQTELPIYKPMQPKAEIKSVSRSDSTLCHISVGKWMKKEGVGFLSAQQMERCGRLSADVAAKTTDYLNDMAAGKFVAASKSQLEINGMPSQNNCTECHGSEIPAVPKPGGGESLIKTAE